MKKIKFSYLFILGFCLLPKLGFAYSYDKYGNIPDEKSKTVQNGQFGSGMSEIVENVTSCRKVVIGAEELIDFLPIYSNCYQACATITFSNSTGFTFYDDEGYPIEGTQTRRTKKQVFEVCGRSTCDESDVISSCEAKARPYLDLCRANGHCQDYSGPARRSQRSPKRNSYYRNTNPTDPGYKGYDE